MRDKVVWEDLPRAKYGQLMSSKWLGLLLPLTKKPGAWARVMECRDQGQASSIASYVNHRVTPPVTGRWQAASRTVDGHYYVYARYLGPEAGNGSEP